MLFLMKWKETLNYSIVCESGLLCDCSTDPELDLVGRGAGHGGARHGRVNGGVTVAIAVTCAFVAC